MIGNGMRPNIWGKFKERFGVQEVLELYASSEGNVGFSNIFNFDNTVGFSPTLMPLLSLTKEKNELVRDKKGHCKKVKTGELGLLVGKLPVVPHLMRYTDQKRTNLVILKDVFKG